MGRTVCIDLRYREEKRRKIRDISRRLQPRLRWPCISSVTPAHVCVTSVLNVMIDSTSRDYKGHIYTVVHGAYVRTYLYIYTV